MFVVFAVSFGKYHDCPIFCRGGLGVGGVSGTIRSACLHMLGNCVKPGSGKAQLLQAVLAYDHDGNLRLAPAMKPCFPKGNSWPY